MIYIIMEASLVH